MSQSRQLGDFPHLSFDKLRYADTDMLGHANKVTFATFFETGRVELLYHRPEPLAAPGCGFVIARLAIDFAAEILWPGKVDIGTRVVAIGRSSVTLGQALFQDGRHVASSQSVIVQIDLASRKSRPLAAAAWAVLESLCG